MDLAVQRPDDSVLVLFPGALGDFLCFLPALLGIRARHRGTLVLVASPSLVDLLVLPDVEGVSIDRREVADLFNPAAPVAAATQAVFGGFATAYSWTGSADAVFARRLAEATGGRVSVFPSRGMLSGEHAAAYYARCAGVASYKPIAAHIRQDDTWLAGLDETQRTLLARGILVVHPGSGSRTKNWCGYLELVRRWRQRHGQRVAWLSGPAETHIGGDLGSEAPVFQGLSLAQVAALLRKATRYVGNDSGISHLAGVLGVRGVVLFGPSDPSVWAPLGGTLEVLRGAADCPTCTPERFCVHRLPVGEVIDTLGRLGEPVGFQ
jgi:heptosyltransferase III